MGKGLATLGLKRGVAAYVDSRRFNRDSDPRFQIPDSRFVDVDADALVRPSRVREIGMERAMGLGHA